MSFMDARDHGSKPGSGGAASSQNEVRSDYAAGSETNAVCFGKAVPDFWIDGSGTLAEYSPEGKAETAGSRNDRPG